MRKQAFIHSFRIALYVAMLLLCVSLQVEHLRIARAAGETVTIDIMGPTQPPGFTPALLTVHVYDTVIFVNQASPAANYSIVADDGSFNSPNIAPGKQWIVAFNAPGEHEYHISTASAHMVGIIIVVPNSVSLLPTPAPGIEATAIALIKAGKTPPDTLSIPVTTPVSPASSALTTSTRLQQPSFFTSGWVFPALLIGGAVIIVAVFGTGIFYLSRLLRKRWKKRRSKDEDDDDYDDDEDENEDE